MNQPFNSNKELKIVKIQIFILFLALVLSAALLLNLNCSGKKSPLTGTEAPEIPAQSISASTDSPDWTRYLAYSRPPSETVIIESCKNTADFPSFITPTLEKIVDNGYRSLSETYYRGGGGYYLLDSGMLLNGGEEKTTVPSSSQSQNPPERSVAEPDIYALGDNLLFTLNIYRGLQAIKINNPKNPQYASGVYIPGFPNELYLKGNLVISTVAGFKPGYGWSSMNAPVLDPNDPLSTELAKYLEGKVVVLDVKNPEQIETVSELPLPGTLIESRIVGDILYAVTFTPDSIVVSSFNLAGAPDIRAVDQEIISFPATWDWSLLAYTHLYVSPEYLFISVPIIDYTELEYYETSDIYCLDVSDPAGQIKARGKMNVPGHIADRFKMDLYNQTFRVIGGGALGSNNNLSIFDVSNPDQPELLSTKSIGQFEQLFASRFDGNRAYIVTYQRKDPLWILDLSNPASPMVVGELTVPGWSQYIEPLGDRLVTLGVDDEGGRRAMVSLFSVEDPTNPRLLDKVTVGSGYSTSYGYADYKAFKVLPDQNLIMLPWSDYQGFGWWGYRLEDQVTLIDLLRDQLKERGSLAHIGTVERPFLADNHAFILSQSAVQIADIDDRDHPQTLSLLRLLRSAKTIVPAGKFALVEDENSWWEVVKLGDSGLKPTARIKISGSAVSIMGDADNLYIIRESEAVDADNPSRVEIHRLRIPENGQPQVTGCFAFPSNIYFSPQTLISLGGSRFGLYGSVYRESYYGGDVTIVNAADPEWYYKEGVLVLEAAETGAIAPAKFIEIQNSSIGSGGYSYLYSSYTSNPLVRGQHLYLTDSETIEPQNYYYSYPETLTTVYYAVRLDLSDPGHPSLLLVNIPGELLYVSENEEKFYYQKTQLNLSSIQDGVSYYQYYPSDYFLGACRYNAQGFLAGDEIALSGYPAVSFSNTQALLLSGLPYYYWYGEYSGGSAPEQSLSLIKTDDITDLQVIDSLALPAFEAGYSLNGFAGGRAFLSLGPFINPKRIRELAISQGSWSSSEDEMYAYLDLIYRVKDSRFEFEHVHPSTNWNPSPVISGDRVLVPAGMYGIEVLR
ncbi:MAG: beta-propeller domain-containing protein [bacterium]|nr:beta-propeller domain-containing protein [bacterium]